MNNFIEHIDFKKIVFISSMLVCLPLATLRAEDSSAVGSPTSAWLVGPARLDMESSESAGRVPCVVANQFSNGLTVRFSGGGDQLMAMAVDFHRDIFMSHMKYDAEFSVPGQYFQVISGAAYDKGTLLFSLYKLAGFYKALQNNETLSIKANNVTVAINLVGLNDGFRRMNECYDPSSLTRDKGKPDVQGNSQSDLTRPNPLLANGDGLTPMPGEQAGERTGEQAPAAPRPDLEKSVDAVLNNGGDVSPAGGSASQLIEKAREANQAAVDLAARNPNRPGQAAAKSWAPPKILRPQGSDILSEMPQNAASTPKDQQVMRWRAIRGSDLHDVLDSWAQPAGVKLLWLPAQTFTVDRSISLSGDFNTAIKTLLGQYDDQAAHPVGRMYREPGTQNPVLVIDLQPAQNGG